MNIFLQNKTLYIILFILFILIVIISAFYFYFSNNLHDVTFEGVPLNYSECMKTDEAYNFQNRNRSTLSCLYTVLSSPNPYVESKAVDKEKYDECVQEKGHPVSYAGDCSLLFYNPQYIFPKSFRECVDEKKGEFSTSVKPHCVVEISVFLAYNKDVAAQLIKSCTQEGGSYSEEFGQRCYLKFTEPGQ